jgi:putative tryptophan/tyrosine transport system substrate-binding protein
MKRRELLLLLGGAVAAPDPLCAQQRPVMPVLGFLGAGGTPSAQRESSLAAFRKGLSEAGYVEGQNLTIEYHWAEGHYDRLPALAADLVARNVNVIVSIAVAPTQAAKDATSTIPIVFAFVSDPVGYGFVASLARPGGNLTGFSNIVSQLTPKRLELLAELVPQAKVIALLVHPNSPTTEPLIQDMQEATRAKGMQLAVLRASTETEIDSAFAALVELHVEGLVVAGDPFLSSRRDRLVALASRHAVPAIYNLRSFAEAGGLISYGIDNIAIFPQVGVYAGRILQGAKPADMPVQQPTKFELVINLKTAKALGLTIPRLLLLRADEVIE